jgi:hypothetical protein
MQNLDRGKSALSVIRWRREVPIMKRSVQTATKPRADRAEIKMPVK